MEKGAQSGAYYAIIPADVRYDPELRPNAKLLYAELTSLCNQKGYCWAPNDYFAELYGLTVETISRLISQLETRGYIRCEMVKAGKGRERRIYAGAFLVQEAPEEPEVSGEEASGEPGEGGIDKNVKEGDLDKNVKMGIDKNVKTPPLDINNKYPPISPQGGKGTARGKPPKQDPELVGRFETFWASYPRKDGKQKALRAWLKLKPSRELCAVMWDALERAKRSRQWAKDNGEYIPMMSTWLNQERWKDAGIDRSQLPAQASDDSGGWAPDPEVSL